MGALASRNVLDSKPGAWMLLAPFRKNKWACYGGVGFAPAGGAWASRTVKQGEEQALPLAGRGRPRPFRAFAFADAVGSTKTGLPGKQEWARCDIPVLPHHPGQVAVSREVKEEMGTRDQWLEERWQRKAHLAVVFDPSA